MDQTIFGVLQSVRTVLLASYQDFEHASVVARRLVEHAAGQALTKLFNISQEQLKKIEEDALAAAHRHIGEHVPLAYLIGSVPFCGVSIAVQPPLLIPRPETEEWVSALIADFQPMSEKAFTILDLCTGSGCIAVALAAAFKYAHIVAVDFDERAVRCAQANAARNNQLNIVVQKANVCESLAWLGQFDLIATNPPYIPEVDYESLEPSVRLWEAREALVGGPVGNEVITSILNQLPFLLKKESSLHHYPRVWIESDTVYLDVLAEQASIIGIKKIEKMRFMHDRVAVLKGWW